MALVHGAAEAVWTCLPTCRDEYRQPHGTSMVLPRLGSRNPARGVVFLLLTARGGLHGIPRHRMAPEPDFKHPPGF